MTLAKKSRAELIAIIEAERDVTKRARGCTEDLRREHARRQEAEKEANMLRARAAELSRECERLTEAAEKSAKALKANKNRVERGHEDAIRQRDETIAALRSKLDAVPWDDVKEAREYRRKMEMVRGNDRS